MDLAKRVACLWWVPFCSHRPSISVRDSFENSNEAIQTHKFVICIAQEGVPSEVRNPANVNKAGASPGLKADHSGASKPQPIPL